jgi:hypothetical protein
MDIIRKLDMQFSNNKIGNKVLVVGLSRLLRLFWLGGKLGENEVCYILLISHF